MESLHFVLLFSVVVIAWVTRITHVKGSVSSVKQNRSFWLLSSKEQTHEGKFLNLPCSVPVTVATKRTRMIRLRGDRRLDSGRGRPLLCLN